MSFESVVFGGPVNLPGVAEVLRIPDPLWGVGFTICSREDTRDIKFVTAFWPSPKKLNCHYVLC